MERHNCVEIPSHKWFESVDKQQYAWVCCNRISLSADPCENACPSAYAYISLLYTFNYNTVPVLPLSLTHTHSHTHTHRDTEKAESLLFPVMQITSALKTVWVRIKRELNEAWLFSLHSIWIRQSPVTMGDPHAVAMPVMGLTRQEVT